MARQQAMRRVWGKFAGLAIVAVSLKWTKGGDS
jgi:hypothetical protein